jgi:Leucine-rich repeat (LRR) protein
MAARTKRRFFQFKLRTLLVLVTLVSVGLAVFAITTYKDRQRQAIAEPVLARGGSITFDLDSTTATAVDLSGCTLTNDELEQILTRAQNIKHLDLSRTNVTDESLRQLWPTEDDTGTVRTRTSNLPNLKFLLLDDTNITDVGIRILARHTELRGLSLRDTAITDEAALDLAKMPALERISLPGGTLSDGALERLEKALPECHIVEWPPQQRDSNP